MNVKYYTILLAILIFNIQNLIFSQCKISPTSFCDHKVVLDDENKLLPWYTEGNAYDHFLHIRWDFIKNKMPNAPGPAPRSNYPQFYFYASFTENDGKIEPVMWMNDPGEKVNMLFESARLYYAYTGDSSVMEIAKDYMDYTLEHGISPSDFAWPNFPYTAVNPGETEFKGFNKAGFALHEVHVDHAGELGYAYYRMYLYTGDKKYLQAATNVADVLAKNVRKGSATQSVWPYRVLMSTGEITSEYGANWTGCFMLLDNLIKEGVGNVRAYERARELARDFLLEFPLKTGYWTDGHTDTAINSNTYKSNLSASNFKLGIFDYPELDPNWKTNMPKLIKWTEDNFVHKSAIMNAEDYGIGLTLEEANGIPLEPSTIWGANIVGEQDIYFPKMDYMTARYAAECARWYAVSGDESYKEKAFRALNFVTYCNDDSGMAFESPFSNGVSPWWGDCYGEAPRMFYQAFAGIPEWAPAGENHILYSEGIITDVLYDNNRVQYLATNSAGIDYLRLTFKPVKITENSTKLKLRGNLDKEGYTLRSLGNGDYAVNIKRSGKGRIIIEGL
ncbi:hypothetical protein [Anaerotignum sp.]|uniref:hypothetical protein n=1 Tax=Anaerotignum sp. TaxID=2039241 RepID=UPI002714BFCF|nr:hypothetical protein [Anaerotignum sp.]